MKLISGLAAVALAATTLAQPASAASTPVAPTKIAGDWITGQLTDGLAVGQYGADIGLTIDAGLALDALGRAAAAGSIGDAIADQLVTSADVPYGYVLSDEYDYMPPYAYKQVGRYANATAKAAAFTQRIGRNPAIAYADIDLVAQLEELTDDTTGLIADDSFFGNYANAIGQSFAAEALTTAGSDEAPAAVGALLDQQCPAGYFRFTLAATACSVDAAGTSPDTTALAVLSLLESGATSAGVTTAVARATAWLESVQSADGSLLGDSAAPGSNSNSTGLAGWALGRAGRLGSAAKAAAWTRGMQVSDAGVCASQAPTGAIAYNPADLAAGRSGGLSNATVRDKWRRATFQASPVLQWAPAASVPLTISTPSSAAERSTVTATVTGLAAGEYACVTSSSAARSVQGTGSAVDVPFELPAGTGTFTFSVTTLGGTESSTTTVPTPTPTSTPTPTPSATPTPAPTRGSVSGVRLQGPVGYQRAGSTATLSVRGAVPGAHYVLRGPGVDDAAVVVGSDGVLNYEVTLPKATTTASYVLFGVDGQVADDTRVLGRTTFKVSTLPADGPRTRVLVRHLAAGEKVHLVVSGETLARGRANDAGRFVARIELPEGRDTVRLRAVGQFPVLRSGATTLTP